MSKEINNESQGDHRDSQGHKKGGPHHEQHRDPHFRSVRQRPAATEQWSPPNGEPKEGSPVASTLIYGSEDAVLTDPAFATDQAHALGDWIAGKGRNLTDIFITRGHGDQHLYLGESVVVDGFGPWREAIGKVAALEPRRIVCGHQNKQLGVREHPGEDIGQILVAGWL